MFSIYDIAAHALGVAYPNAPQEWLDRAARETVSFSTRHKNPTPEQRDAFNARIERMCTTGEW
ncbi:hypothetical protein KNV00_gp100 [Streptomyces phage Bmoc]|uniref:Uncharacterized protein n=1 Tax=Streptomyces phage Bmoc TaxID=2725629 RepID=A0A6M3SZ34_9CAUD|nr:hypothetical protein KNV00_gp100 [Streptomyces phage Bmoc]QJD50919.1 hypothetical protein SEA_BMOC_208 [Streptomyces phage Bmoc]